MDAYREQYDILIAEDKVMDKAFKREFNDVTAVQQDQLYRLFRKRPRFVYKNQCGTMFFEPSFQLKLGTLVREVLGGLYVQWILSFPVVTVA